ncbi:MAG: phage portal protein [Acidobacteria bacterium]|nr:phage portal protein [Acidobacteriota bacterium]
MNKHIEEALDIFRLQDAGYARAERYYDGQHDLRFASDQFENTFGALFREFALNLCPVVCDAVRDKLRIVAFGVDGVSPKSQVQGPRSASGHPDEKMHASRATPLKDAVARTPVVRSDTRQIWQSNRGALLAGDIHKEALKTGDAYALVWPDENGVPRIYPNRARSVAVVYDDERPGEIVRAAKVWRDAAKHVRLNMYYADRIERYISRNTAELTYPDAGGFEPLTRRNAGSLPAYSSDNTQAGSLRSDDVIPNPYGRVPVFHFANNADLGAPGRSELADAIPIQDGLNKSVLDMLVAMEFSAFRQRWVAGIEIKYDDAGKPIPPFKAGVDHLWIAEDSSARFGDLDAAELDQFLKVKDSFRVDIASVTGTPLHYFLQNTQGFPSGESLKRAESRFIAKVRDRQESFGQVWAEVMEFALRIQGIPDVGLITEWEDPAPASERELLENLILKKQLGLTSEKALIEAGYGAEDVKNILATENTEDTEKYTI